MRRDSTRFHHIIEGAIVVSATTALLVVGGVAGALGNSSAPVSCSSAPVGNSSAPVGLQSPPVGSHSAPVGTQSAPVGIQSAPVECASAPVTTSTTVKPTTTTTSTTVKPTTTTSTTVKPTTTTTTKPTPFVHGLQVSAHKNRSASTALSGQQLSGKVYIFDSAAATQTDKVDFYLDGRQVRIEQVTPYDLEATDAQGNAYAFDVSQLKRANHTITAYVTEKNGTIVTDKATFSVR